MTEGTSTEPLYFKAIRDKINQSYSEKIHLDISGEGENTINLFWRAVQLVKENAGVNVYKHVWVVYDTDDFPADNVDEVVKLCKEYSTEETKYHPIWSNQCIELWFLLHFCYMQSDIHRTEYFTKLSDWFESIGKGKYEKNRDDIYEILYPYMDCAIAYAKKLDVINEGLMPSKAAPGTKVYELVEKLRCYLVEEKE